MFDASFRQPVDGSDGRQVMEPRQRGEADEKVPVLELIECFVEAADLFRERAAMCEADEGNVVLVEETRGVERPAVDRDLAPVPVTPVVAEHLLDLADGRVGGAVLVAAVEKTHQSFEVRGQIEVVVVEIGHVRALRGGETRVQRAGASRRARRDDDGHAAARRGVEKPGRERAAVVHEHGLEVGESLCAQAVEGLCEEARPVLRPEQHGNARRARPIDH